MITLDDDDDDDVLVIRLNPNTIWELQHKIQCSHSIAIFSEIQYIINYDRGIWSVNQYLISVVAIFFPSEMEWPSSSSEGAEQGFEEVSLADEHYQTANNISGLPSPGELPRSEHTAQQIIQLLHEMGTSPAIIDRSTVLDRDFMPCKFCSEVLQHV